jgi:tricorn protease
VAAAGGHAVRLTSHPGDDLISAWSADGERIAFDSDRNGYRNLYIMNADGTGVRQVSDIDRACELIGFGADEEGREVLTFDAAIEGDVYRSERCYMISTNGGEIRSVHRAYGTHAAIGPDGKQVLFTRGGSSWSRRHYRGPDDRDVWLYRRGDGSFRQLTDWTGNDGQARWANDGTMVFLSDRAKNCVNVYRADIAAGAAGAEPLTSFADNDVTYLDVSGNGSTAVITVWDTLYTLDLSRPGTEPKRVVVTANEDEQDNYEIKAIDREASEAALSPDGKTMAYIAYGEVYVRDTEEKSPTARVTNHHAREKEIAWSPDGLTLYFVSDRTGVDAIYAATVAMTRGEIIDEFKKTTKTGKDEPAEQPAADEKKESAEEKSADNADKKEDGDEEKEDESDDKKDDEKPKSKKDEKLPKELRPERWRDAIKFNIELVATGGRPAAGRAAHNDRNPSPSPDGKKLAFRRGRGDLLVLDLAGGETQTLAQGWDFGIHWRWSPDSRHIAYVQSDLNFNDDIWIVPADGSSPAVNVTRHPDNDLAPRWSADGKILAFLSERVNEEFDVWMVYLDKDLEAYTPKELNSYYEERIKAVKKLKPLPIKKPKEASSQPATGEGAATQPASDESAKDADKKKPEPKPLDLDDAYLRLQRITSMSDNEGNLELTPAGDRYIFSATLDERGLYSVKWDRSDQKKISGPMDVQHLTLTGDKIVVVSGGRAATVPPTGGKVEYVDISDKIRIDLQQQSSQKFREAARRLGEEFYHPTMKDLDWPALTEKYHALARQTRTADEFNDVANRFIGELNASHLAIRARSGRTTNALSMGRLGIEGKRVEGGYEVARVIPHSPAATGPMALKPGDIITAVDFQPFGETDTLETHLRGKAGQEVVLAVRRTIDEAPVELNVLMTPTSYGGETGLKYDDWRQGNARRVEEWSDGRIGYIHIQGMNQPSLDVFERDLYAAASGKAGLIIDVRNNGGGWTADRLMSSIMVQRHAYTVPRGADGKDTKAYPQDRLFIQRYTLPINMLCNEKSFSNAEITSHAFKTLKRGKLVGQETYGGVISTGGWSLIDGTFVRLPFRGWYLTDGTDMENHGAVPDIVVPQTPEAESRDDDEQLRAAVDDLLKRLEPAGR